MIMNDIISEVIKGVIQRDDFIMPFEEAMPAGFTFARSSVKNRFNSSGNLEEIGVDVPCIDHDMNGNPLGMRFEQAASNRAKYSRDFSQTGADGYTSLNQTVARDAIGLNGVANTATTVTATGASNYRRHTNGISVTAGELRVDSFYARSLSSGSVNYRLYDVTNGAQIGSVVDYTSQLDGDNWVRIYVAYTVPALCTEVYLYPVYNMTSGESIVIDGIQDEDDRGDGKPSSLIDTENSVPVTRSADGRAYTTNVKNLYPLTEGAIICEYIVDYDGDNFDTIFSYSTNSTSKGVYARISQSTGFLEPVVFDSGSQISGMSEGIPTPLQDYVYGLSFKKNDFKSSLDGGTVRTDTSGTVPSGLTHFIVGGATISGAASSQRPFNGWIKNIYVLNRSLWTSMLQAKTSQ